MTRVLFWADKLVNDQKLSDDPLAKLLMDNLKLNANAHKRVKRRTLGEWSFEYTIAGRGAFVPHLVLDPGEL